MQNQVIWLYAGLGSVIHPTPEEQGQRSMSSFRALSSADSASDVFADVDYLICNISGFAATAATKARPNKNGGVISFVLPNSAI